MNEPVGTARVSAAPRTPTKVEREEHDVSHVPYRPWCRICVTGRGLERRHVTQSGDRDDDRPRVFADCDYFSGDSTPLLIAKDRRTGMTFAAAVSMKGCDPHAARLLAKWIDGLGCREVTARTDGEPSICELIRRVRELRAEGTTTVDEISPPGDPAGNGIAESATLTVRGLVRTTKAVIEENVFEGRNAGPRLIAWMVHHAAQVICAWMVGADGLTPFRRLKGRKFGRTRVSQRPDSGKSKQVRPEVHRGEIAWILPQVPLHRGRFRREIPHRRNGQESQRRRQMESCVAKGSCLGRRFGVNAS